MTIICIGLKHNGKNKFCIFFIHLRYWLHMMINLHWYSSHGTLHAVFLSNCRILYLLLFSQSLFKIPDPVRFCSLRAAYFSLSTYLTSFCSAEFPFLSVNNNGRISRQICSVCRSSMYQYILLQWKLLLTKSSEYDAKTNVRNIISACIT